MLLVIKKDGTTEQFDKDKIIRAVGKSAERAMVRVSDEDFEGICTDVFNLINPLNEPVKVITIHNAVEKILDKYNEDVAKSYKDYRNYKKESLEEIEDIYREAQDIRWGNDKENSNRDSTLTSTKTCLISHVLGKAHYRRFFMTRDELQACKDGYIYVHDQAARLDTINCSLFRADVLMNGGFEMGNIHYNEPNSLDVAFDVLGDITLSAASQQYGGFTVAEIDKLLAPYAGKSYKLHLKEICEIANDNLNEPSQINIDRAMAKVKREFEQGFQGIEMKLNTVGSSRGDYPFVTMTFGLDTSVFGKMASITFLEVHMKGQGEKGKEKPVLFPKLVFLYDENIHGEGKESEDVFMAGIKCSAKTMYPDWLSLTGEGYVPSMYKKYGKVISPMGCRAFLSPWYQRGGMKPADEKDVPIFDGRFNIGAVSLNLPMILAKARRDSRSFHVVLDYYLEMIRGIHKRTYAYLGQIKASTNPLGFTEGGFYGGFLSHGDKIEPLLKPMTASFGITALNELQRLYNNKSLVQDGEFALETLKYINEKVNGFKEEDGWLYAIYGTPAESLCGLQAEQFRKHFGMIDGVSDKDYVSNSFHCHVSEDITPVEKQDLENRFWDLCNGGKIQYVRYPVNYNIAAIIALVRRAMKLGYYEGVNMELSYCNDCGHQELDMKECPKCYSRDLTIIVRMNGYLSFGRVRGESRLNDDKMSEVRDRVSM